MVRKKEKYLKLVNNLTNEVNFNRKLGKELSIIKENLRTEQSKLENLLN